MPKTAASLCEHRNPVDSFCPKCVPAAPAVRASLPALEKKRLGQLEAVVERGMATFVDVGQALLEIRDSRLYRDAHSTFDDYCRARWGFSRSRGYRLIEAASIASMLPMGDKPTGERQARELVPLRDEPEKLREAWAEVVETGTPTVARVRDAVTSRLDAPAAQARLFDPDEYVARCDRLAVDAEKLLAAAEDRRELVTEETLRRIAAARDALARVHDQLAGVTAS